MEISKKIKEARTKSGLTQEQAAESILVSRQTISNWENGKSSPDILSVIKMSALYEISLDELLKGDKAMMKKIEQDTNIVKSNRRVIIIGCIATIFAVALTITNIVIKNTVLDFASAAAPWILLGVTLACVCAYRGNVKEK